MINYNIKTITFLLLCLFLIMNSPGCSEKKLELGKWHVEKENHKFMFLKDKEKQFKVTLKHSELRPSFLSAQDSNSYPVLESNTLFFEIKSIMEEPKPLNSKFQSYSVLVTESGYLFLQVTKKIGADKNFDKIEWGWKIILENKSKDNIYALGDYALLNKEGFILTRTDGDSKKMNYEKKEGFLIKAGSKGIIKGTDSWIVNSESSPYTPERVAKGEYALYLRHSTPANKP